jgi:hypothetical protein
MHASVNVGTMVRARQTNGEVKQGTWDFSCIVSIQTGAGIHTVPFPEAFRLELMRPGRETSQLHFSSNEVKNIHYCMSTAQINLSRSA